jgi:hypothetical protein
VKFDEEINVKELVLHFVKVVSFLFFALFAGKRKKREFSLVIQSKS